MVSCGQQARLPPPPPALLLPWPCIGNSSEFEHRLDLGGLSTATRTLENQPGVRQPRAAKTFDVLGATLPLYLLSKSLSSSLASHLCRSSSGGLCP